MDLGLILNIANLISKAAKIGTTLLSEAFWDGVGLSTYTQWVIDIGDTPTEITQSEPQAFDVVGTSQTPTPPPADRLFTSQSPSTGYALVSQSFLFEVKKRLGTIKKKVKLIEKGVTLWVQKQIRDEIQSMQTLFDRFKQWISWILEGVKSPDLESVQAEPAVVRKQLRIYMRSLSPLFKFQGDP